MKTQSRSSSGFRFAAIAAVALVVAGVIVALKIGTKSLDAQESGDVERPVSSVNAGAVSTASVSVEAEDDEQGPESSESKTPDEEEVLSEDERREREEEARVEAFDALTDKWMEPATDGVSMKDVDEFSAQFSKVPRTRREECLQRALNLVPDENVMLLAGILMDKSQDKELVELVYNDVLNRAEDVKKPILQQIFKDKTHPCWADTAWIFDATGESSEEK